MEQTLPTRIQRWDNPESVRIRKYLTGTNLLVDAVGIDVGASPKSLTWSRGKARLYRFTASGEDRYGVPLLIVYALILRPYILDLVAGRSVVQEFVQQGFDVYLLDWGVPDEADDDLGFEHYVLDVLAGAVEAVLDRSSASQLSLLGHCQGGTLAAMYAALEPQLVRNLVLLGAPIDFSPDPPGLMGTWTLWTRQNLPQPEWLLGPTGLVPADVPTRLTQAATKLLASPPGVSDALTVLRDRLSGDEEIRAWLGVCRWVDDSVPLAGRMFRQWLRWFYHDNRLVSGGLQLRDRHVDLSRVAANLLTIAATLDAITPLPQAKTAPTHLASPDAESLIIEGAGHVGLVVGPMARDEVWRPASEWLAARSGDVSKDGG